MATCVFCPNDLDSTTKPEHILLNGLGGRKTTTRVICSDCNNRFGSDIDRAITDQVSVIRNLLQLPSGTGSTPPMLRRVAAGNDTLNLMGDGSIDLVTKPFTITDLPDGNKHLSINVRSLDEINRHIPNIAKALGITEDKVREFIANSNAKEIERRPDTIKFSLSFGGEKAIRSAAKACLVLWATHVGNEEVNKSEYDDVRDFVYNGSEHFNRNRCDLDARTLPNAGEIQEKFGTLFNMIYVRSNSQGKVVGHFTLYNLVGFQIVLAQSGGIPNKQIALGSNPLDPVVWSDTVAIDHEIDFDWLDSPDYDSDVKRPKARVEAMMRTYFDIGRPKEISRICDDVFRKFNIADNQAVPPEVWSEISSVIADRISKHVVSLPYEQNISAAELRSAVLKPDAGGE